MSNELKYIPWPGWEMVREIGRGTFGTVYEIKHDLITEEEHAALKVLSVPQNESEIKSMRSEGLAADEITQTVKDQAGRILREYKNLSDLQGAPNIVRCNAVHHEMHKDGIGVDVYILMELLIPLLDKADELLQTEAQIVGFAIDMCHALIACEDKKILHRDIKPENIFVSKEGIYKLGDFGIARSHDHTTYGTKGMGTPSYMAPEIANGGAYNKQADIYSLGIVLYWLLNKRRTPFLPLPPKGIRLSDREEALRRRCSGDPIPAPANGSKELQRIVLKACAFDQRDRYQSAADLLADLSVLAGVQPTVVPLMPDISEDGSDGMADSVEEEATCGPIFSKVSTDKTAEETVGPIFIPSAENKSEDQEETVGPAFKPKDKPEQPNKKKRIWPIIVAVCACTILGGLYIMSRPIIERVTPSFEDLENYLVEGYSMIGGYEVSRRIPVDMRSKVKFDVGENYNDHIVLITNETQEFPITTNVLDGVVEATLDSEGTYWIQVQTDAEDGLEWSEWSAGLPDEMAMNSDVIQYDIMYRNREKVFTTAYRDTLDGWELYDTFVPEEPYGEWSDWKETVLTADEYNEVEEQKQYRSRKKEYTTSTSAAMDGWTQYKSEKNYEYGPWSDWYVGNKQSTDTMEIELMMRYPFYYDSYRDGSYDYSAATTGSADRYTVGQVFESGYYEDGASYYRIITSRGEGYYNYRKRTKTYLSTTYYYSRWSDWTDWGTDSVTAKDGVEVEDRTLYRTREVYGDVGYRFWKWSDWSDWALDKLSDGMDTEVEACMVYRSCP